MKRKKFLIRLITLTIAITMCLVIAPTVSADTWDVTGTHNIEFTCTSGCSGDYLHTMTVNLMDFGSGVFSGTGYYNVNPGITWTVTGTVGGTTISFYIDYDGSAYYVDATGTINPDGSMSGTANSASQSFTWTIPAGSATFVDTTAPVVTINSPIDGSLVSGTVDIFGSIIEENELSHYNIAVYPGGVNFMDFSQRLEQETKYLSSGFDNELIYQWDTTAYPDGEYLIRLAARDKAGNRDISGSPYLGGDDSQHVITVIVDNTAPIITFEEPVDGSIQTGVMHLKATCNEVCDYVNFWWRAENEPFAWYRYHYVHDDGTVFEWDLDTLNAELAQSQGSYQMDDGIYYLYAAGKDLAGNWARTPEVMVYVINDGLVYGGGHALEALNEGDKRKDWLDISFGGMLGDADEAGLVGEWQINFHNVNVDDFDKSRFHTTDITSLNLFVGNTDTCTEAMNFGANGEWNGIPGYRIIFRAGDSSEPSSYDTDTVRVTLYDPDNSVVYDSSWPTEFSDESSCVGNQRTGLDTGNIVIQG